MSTTSKSQYKQKILNCLKDYLANFPEESTRLGQLLDQIKNDRNDITSRKNYKGHLTGSSLFLNPLENKVLLIHHISLDMWIQPGGHLNPLELPLDGAIREFTEEIGINDANLHSWHHKFTIPLDIDTHYIPANPKKSEPEHFHHDFLYLLIPYMNSEGNPGTASFDLDVNYRKEELKGLKWVTLDELKNGDYEEKLKRTARKLLEIMA